MMPVVKAVVAAALVWLRKLTSIIGRLFNYFLLFFL